MIKFIRSFFKPCGWLLGHCYHHMDTLKEPITCKYGVVRFAFPQVANCFSIYKCCNCPKYYKKLDTY